jgi:hypothetical protein
MINILYIAAITAFATGIVTGKAGYVLFAALLFLFGGWITYRRNTQ